jgi:uncharacterized protein (DUF2235 family)
MKRIAIFCDGTWNRPDAKEPTNVYELYKATRQVAMDGKVQLPKYIPGVGTGFGMAGFQAGWDRVRGGAFGIGVTRNIENAYRFLAEQYAPGDEIYIFGFSRGAFTARSLAGMIRASGLPPNELTHRVGEALRRYRRPDRVTLPDTHESHRFRARFSPDYVTSEKESRWRDINGFEDGALIKIRYLGIWDTVGALGVPGHLRVLAALLNGGHRFHDLSLSASVEAARHAVALDEKRKLFPPTLWDNLGDLNREDEAGARRYRQEWFPGDHGSVGGGGDIKGLSHIALRWVAAGAAEQGLDFDWVRLQSFMQHEDVQAPLVNKSGEADWMTRLMRLVPLDRPSEFKIQSWEISEAAQQRHKQDPSYRPELF